MTGNAYTDDEGFGSEPPTNGPESLQLSLNGALNSGPNTTSTSPTTPGKHCNEYLYFSLKDSR